MSRSVSAVFKQAVNAQETNQVFLLLITISHPNLAVPIRCVVNDEDITSRGNIFQAYPVDVELPDDVEDAPPQARLTIDNISTEITRAVRAIRSKPTVLLEIVLSEDLDTVEIEFPSFDLVDISYDSMTVTGSLQVDDFTREPYPSISFTPGYFPGLFN